MAPWAALLKVLSARKKCLKQRAVEVIIHNIMIPEIKQTIDQIESRLTELGRYL